MERNERLESGEKLFVIGMVVGFVVEVAYATASVIDRTLDGFLLGVIGALVMLRLANWLYTGNNTALKCMLGWAGLQIVLAVGALLILSAATGRDNPASRFGYSISWVPFGKLAAYVIVAGLLVSPSVRAFLFLKAGGDLAEIKDKAPLAPSGTTLPLTAEQSQIVARLANLLGWASLVLIVVGALRTYFGWTLAHADVAQAADWIKGGPMLAEGILLLLVGVLLLGPAGAFDFLKTKSTDTTYLMNALDQLSSLYQKQLVLTALVAAGVLAAIVARL